MNNLISNGNQSDQSTKQKFREALKLTKTKKMKKAVTKAATQMKKEEIDYSTVLNTKDNTTSGGKSNAKSKSLLSIS